MNKLSPMVRVPVRFGAIAGVLGAILLVVLYYLGRHPLLFPPYFDFRIILFGLFMFFSLREYRDDYRNGELHLWEGIIICFLLVTVYAVVASVLMYAFASYDGEFVRSYVVLFKEQVKTFPKEMIDQIGKDKFDAMLQETDHVTNLQVAEKYFFQSYLFAFFLSVIFSVILRRQQPKN